MGRIGHPRAGREMRNVVLAGQQVVKQIHVMQQHALILHFLLAGGRICGYNFMQIHVVPPWGGHRGSAPDLGMSLISVSLIF